MYAPGGGGRVRTFPYARRPRSAETAYSLIPARKLGSAHRWGVTRPLRPQQFNPTGRKHDGCSAAVPGETYNDRVVRQFAIMTVSGASSACWSARSSPPSSSGPHLNFGIPWLTYGRLRPLHTNAVIFAFGGNALFAHVYYSSSAPAKCACSATPWRHSLLGLAGHHRARRAHAAARASPSQGVRRARVADRLCSSPWCGSPSRSTSSAPSRSARSTHIYVAIWFYIAFIITVARAAHRQQRRDPGRR